MKAKFRRALLIAWALLVVLGVPSALILLDRAAQRGTDCTGHAFNAYGYPGYVDPYTAAKRTRERGTKCS